VAKGKARPNPKARPKPSIRMYSYRKKKEDFRANARSDPKQRTRGPTVERAGGTHVTT
jgi:hypothetical protein